MKKIMQLALACLLVVGTTAYAGDNRQCTRNCTGKTGSAMCQGVCKKSDCNKTICNTACTKNKCGAKKS